jgi:hypothetical protein
VAGVVLILRHIRQGFSCCSKPRLIKLRRPPISRRGGKENVGDNKAHAKNCYKPFLRRGTAFSKVCIPPLGGPYAAERHANLALLSLDDFLNKC